VSDDGEQQRPEERDGTARPVTAAARRERRASARDAAARTTAPPKGKAAEKTVATPVEKAGAKTKAAAKSATKADADRDSATKGRPTPTRDRRQKRPSLVKRGARFLREVVGELRKVIWPTRKQQITYTVVVLIFVSVIVAVVFGLDTLFAKGVFWVFG
jgi:preprotein translocase subunit SecE